ncbi:hypothetical protein [Blastococcus xanthinilyticus]|uniref:Uncharacterized protein n=1 Tax=Blastococcus xanthinilyticus TaxID=1564164 RepID=A0A5S5CLQ6_9ACTN|nr:hypothetical protein [Blastococcus xanthinilyticus]TYP82050.1 hypothetical protein BD833_12034 [Blastococcus xanthinilyticus]
MSNDAQRGDFERPAAAQPTEHSEACTPELRGAGQYAGECPRCEKAQDWISRFVRREITHLAPSVTPDSDQVRDGRPVLVARCENSTWTDDGAEVFCRGQLRFTWGQSQAPCSTCGAWCGVAVADWTAVECAPAAALAAPAAGLEDDRAG